MGESAMVLTLHAKYLLKAGLKSTGKAYFSLVMLGPCTKAFMYQSGVVEWSEVLVVLPSLLCLCITPVIVIIISNSTLGLHKSAE